MPKSFLPKSLHVLFIVMALFFWLFASLLSALIIILCYILALYIFRQNRLTYKDDVAFKNDVFYSPVSGILKSVRHNVDHEFFGTGLSEVHIMMLPWEEFGIYLPFTCEVKELKAHRGKRLLRTRSHFTKYLEPMAQTGINLICEGVNGSTIGLKFMQCLVGGWPEIALLPGDRGKRRTNIGYFPFGGSLILYLPSHTQLLVEVGDKLIAGVSVFAGLIKEQRNENNV